MLLHVTALTLPTAQPRPRWRAPSAALPVSSRRRQLGSFVVIGTLTTAAYLVLYAALEPLTGAQIANAIALVLTVDANTVANRRFSFGLAGRRHAVRHRAQGYVAFGISLVATSACLAALESGGVTSGSAYLAVLIAANLASGVVHFVLLRSWAFARR
jgi:putative flippase GtrA